MKWLDKFLRRQPCAVPRKPVPEPLPLPPTEPVAIISDIHGNLQALQAVLADIEAQGVRERVCLGDIVGYGGNPLECLKLIRAGGFRCIRGNHDAHASLEIRPTSQDDALQAKDHTSWNQSHEEACRWLEALPLTHEGADYETVHASLHHPDEWNYVDIQPAADLHFCHQTQAVCFSGHTHQSLLWIEGGERPIEGSGIEVLRAGRKHLVNVGSVGQPRDEDPRACYVIYRRTERDVRWRRIAYDIEGAQRAILSVGLPPKNAARLDLGK